MGEEDVLATLEASAGRRILGLASLWLLAATVLYVGIAQPPDIAWQVFLFVLGGGAIWLAEQMRKATASTLELTATMLRESSGEVLVHLQDVAAVERGMFAFKPSNGFLIRCHEPVGARRWRPGLWWRMGRRIGVGGITSAAQAKFMADVMSTMISQSSNPPSRT